jgi:CRP-like cAMP-binding protein
MKNLPQLKDIQIFNTLDDESLEQLSKICRTKFYKKGEPVFYKDDESTDLYIVFHGSLKAILTNDNGDEIILANFKPFDIFGEMNLFDNQGRSLTVIAYPEAVLGIISRDAFFKFLLNHPEVSVEIIKLLINRLRQADELIENITFLNVKDRLINLLNKRAEAIGKIEGDYIKFEKYTHQELAARVAASRESVTKAIKSLINEGFLKADDEFFYINKS